MMKPNPANRAGAKYEIELSSQLALNAAEAGAMDVAHWIRREEAGGCQVADSGG